MEFLYRPEMVEEADRHFDEVVAKIEANDFRILTPRELAICNECNFRPPRWHRDASTDQSVVVHTRLL